MRWALIGYNRREDGQVDEQHPHFIMDNPNAMIETVRVRVKIRIMAL
jgi:hypothetical protein